VITSPPSVFGSDRPQLLKEPVVIDSSVEASELYYDVESAAMERVAIVVRHLGLVVGVGACVLAVGVVVVVTAIACRYRVAERFLLHLTTTTIQQSVQQLS